MDKIVDIFLNVIQKTENKHYVLVKDIIRFLVIVAFASISYARFTGEYKILDISPRSILIYFDSGTFWLCLIYFMVSSLLYFFVRAIIARVHRRLIKNGIHGIEKTNKKASTLKYRSAKYSYILTEELFFENSRHQNVLKDWWRPALIHLCRFLGLIQFDKVKKTYQVDQSKMKELKKVKLEVNDSQFSSVIYFFSDLSASIIFLLLVVICKSVFEPTILLFVIFGVALLALSFCAIMAGLLGKFIPYYEVLFRILERLVSVKNLEKSKNSAVSVYF